MTTKTTSCLTDLAFQARAALSIRHSPQDLLSRGMDEGCCLRGPFATLLPHLVLLHPGLLPVFILIIQWPSDRVNILSGNIASFYTIPL